MSMKDRIKSIAESIINDSFPILKGKKIHYFTMYLRFFAFSAWIPPYLRIVVVSTRTKDLNEFVLSGIIVHELCHQERYIAMGFLRYLRFIISYAFSAEIRRAEERETDRLTITKGYARQLYDLTIISKKDKNHREIIDNYLTQDEIREYAEKHGKW
jgi:hypothetical protein